VVKNALPADELDSLAHNPQALVSQEAQDQLRQMIEPLGQPGAQLFQQVLDALRQSLASALSQVFLFTLFAVGLSFVINLFIKEIPLRKQHSLE